MPGRGDAYGGKKMKLHSDLTWEPPTDVVETEGTIIVLVVVPGMNGREIDVVTDGKVLKISGTRKSGVRGSSLGG